LFTLPNNAVVDYTSGSSGSQLTFNYTLGPGQTSSDLEYLSTQALSLNGGTIRDFASNNAVLTLPGPGEETSLGGSSSISIDTTPATVSYQSTSPVSPSTNVAPNVNMTLSEAASVTLYSDQE